MKKYTKLLAILMIAVLLIIPTVALADTGDQNAAPQGTFVDQMIEPTVALADTSDQAVAPQGTFIDQMIEAGVQILVTLAITAIGIGGTWLTVQIGKSKKLDSINRAQWEVMQLAQQTAAQLQQTVVDGLKAASKDGKLTPGEISALTSELIEKTKEKMSAATYNLLSSAAVDINALIIGAGEEAVKRMAKPAA